VDSCAGVWGYKTKSLTQYLKYEFFQHIKEIFLVENGGQQNSQAKMKKKKFSQKISCIVDSYIRVCTFSPIIWLRICNMGFNQHIQLKILPENLSQNKAKEENEKKTKDLQ
jgi:hypothetical protein